MLESLVSLLVNTLEKAGLSAGPAFPKSSALTSPTSFVRVGIENVQCQDAAIDRYLGLEYRSGQGESERYGLRCEIQLCLDIYAPLSDENAASSCLATFDQTIDAIDGLSGLIVRELSCGTPKPDEHLPLFHLPAALRCHCLLITDPNSPDCPRFTDFILRGVLLS